MIKRSLIFGGGAIGVMSVMPLGGMIKNPWAKGDDSPLWVSGWTPRYEGETIYLRRDTGRPHDIVLVRPEDLDAGAMETVFPFRESRARQRRGAVQGSAWHPQLGHADPSAHRGHPEGHQAQGP